MKPLDVLLAEWRIRRARAFIPPRAAVLDIGCFDGRTLAKLDDARLRVGIDPSVPLARDGVHADGVLWFRGTFPDERVRAAGPFDCVVALAVIEHVHDLAGFLAHAHDCLRPGGRLVMTMPHPRVDDILEVLLRLRLVDGMSVEEHHGVTVEAVRDALSQAGFVGRFERRFQLGLNQVIVARRRDESRDE